MKDKATKPGKSRRALKEAAVLGGSAAGAGGAHLEAAASDALGEGLKQLLDTAAKRSGMGAEQLKGFLFERIEVAKFNVDAARKGLDIRARLTADQPGGHNHPTVDIEILRNGNVVQEIQAKASENLAWLTKAVSKLRYGNTTRLVPEDMAEAVNEIVREEQSVTGQLKQSGAASGGTTNAELRHATNHTRFYAFKLDAIQFAREATITGGYAAAAGAALGGAMSAIRNTYAYSQGKIDRGQAAKNVGVDMVDSGARSGLAAVLGTLIRYSASRVGLQTLSKANFAAAVASGLLEAGGIVREYARGDTTGEEVAERLGQTGCTTVSGIYVGAATGAALGPVGAAVGSVAGFLVAAMVYQSCMEMFKEARLDRNETKRLAALGYEAAQIMERERLALEDDQAELSHEQRAELDQYFTAVELALLTDQSNDAANSPEHTEGCLL